LNHDCDTKYILLIDDNEDDVKLFREAASKNCQAEVFRTGTGAEAISLLIRQEIIPSLIVLEIDLPSADGYALMRFVRQLRAGHGTGGDPDRHPFTGESGPGVGFGGERSHPQTDDGFRIERAGEMPL
jgi:CheY-like chemotaxis protein